MPEAWHEIRAGLEAGLAAWLPGLVTLAIAVAAGLGIAALWRWPLKPVRGWLFDAASAVDRFVVTRGSWVVGTRVRARLPRLGLVAGVLFALGTIGAFAPGSFSYAALLLGVIAILVVYRHWSWDEDDVLSEVPEEEKRVPIAGNLRNEALTAVAFLFFYFPIAFARLQADGIAFSFVPGSGLAALSAFTFIEFVKAVPVFDYYEIFGADLQFERLSAVGEPTLTAKFLTFGLRASFDLVLIACVLRLPEIAKLAQEGRDLRPVDEALASTDEDRHHAAIDAARAFALRKRTRARQRLIQVTEQRLSSDRYRYSLPVRLYAADALVAVGARLDDEAAFLAAAAVYRQDFAERSGGVVCARRKNDYANIMSELARRRAGTLYLQEAIAAYRDALTIYRREWLPEDWAMTQNNLGLALNALANRTKDEAMREAAVEALRGALAERPRAKVPLDWARTQLNLANALCDMGRDEPAYQEQGIAAYRAALEERTRERDPAGWAKTKHNLGVALYDFWRTTSASDGYAEEAIAAYEDALAERTIANGARGWADTQERLAAVLARLGRKRKDVAMMARGIAAYRAALKHERRELRPLDWAAVQNDLANALVALGDLQNDRGLVGEAVAAYGEALEERTRARVPLEWARTQCNLGDALARLGTMTGAAQPFERAIAAYCDAIAAYHDQGDDDAEAQAKKTLARLQTALTVLTAKKTS